MSKPVGVIVIAACVAGIVVAPARGASTTVAPATGALFGATVSNSAGTTHAQALASFEQMIGRQLDTDGIFRNWTYYSSGGSLKSEVADEAAGRIPFIAWMPSGSTTAVAIESGSQDAVIRATADDFRSLDGPVMLRWGIEMNMRPSAPGTHYIGPPADYIAAWQRIYNIFQQEGATNVEFVWCPTSAGFRNNVAAQWYPGDAYVDWIGADGYNRWKPWSTRWMTFADLFNAFYAFGIAHDKPLSISENGSAEDPSDSGRKAQWFSDEETWIEQHPAVKAVQYTNATQKANYHVTTSSSSVAAYTTMADAPYFNTR